MVDQNSQFYAILTNVGAAKQANADALGIPWNITQMGVGDANGADPTPNATQTSLIKEWRRAALNQLKVDDKDPSIIIAEQVIPADVGGHWIREIALYDADGDMVAVANCAPTYKPLLSQGSGRTQVVRMNLVVSSSSNVQLKIDPSVVLATREYVDASILNVLPKNKVAGTFTRVTINERGIVQQGDNPTTLGGYGIADAYTKAAVDAALAGKAGKATTLGGYGIADAYTKSSVDQALAGKADKATTLGGYGIADAYTKAAVDTALAGKANKATTAAGYGLTDVYTKSEVDQSLASRAPLNSPKFTGVPEVPTPGTTEWGAQAVNAKYVRDFMHGLAHIDVAGSGEFALSEAQAGKQLIYLVGVLTGDRTIILPSGFGRYTVRNATGGAFKLTVKMAAGVGVEVAQGKIAAVFTDASNTLLCHTDFTALEKADKAVSDALATKAGLDSPTFTGLPKGPTAPAGTNGPQLATTAFVQVSVADRLKVGDVSQQRPRLASPVSTGGWDSTALEVREVQLVGEWAPAEAGDQWGPGIAFHWGGKYGGKLHMDATGHLKWNGLELQTKQAAAGFLSGYIQITAGAPVVVTHNLGYVPSLDSVEVLWECVTAQGGWQPGESFKSVSWMQDNISTASTTGIFAYDASASTVTLGFGTTASNWALPTKGSGVAFVCNLAYWRVRMRIKQ